MADLKLGKLPDCTPVKLSITIMPELHQALHAYAAIYAEKYGREEPVTELIPAIVSAFLDADRAFMAARRKLADEAK